MSARILCTLGPASLRPDVIAALDARGVDVFRINLSHTRGEDVAAAVELLQRHSATPICLDTEGAQVRCGAMAPGTTLVSGAPVALTADDVTGDDRAIGLRPAAAVAQLRPGSMLRLGFEGAELRVTAVGRGGADAVVTEGGRLGSNKAVVADPPPVLPALTPHDVRSIALGARMGVRHVALSFASGAADVARVRELLPPDGVVIAKIESRAGVDNVDALAQAADAVLIDRGDLSHEVPIEHVPLYQKHIARRAIAANTPVYVATNLLESMLVNREPTLAEANDIINTLADGVHGLVLAAETAIGAHPVQSVDMVLRLMAAYDEAVGAPRFAAPQVVAA
jgi:pyruvate kinase